MGRHYQYISGWKDGERKSSGSWREEVDERWQGERERLIKNVKCEDKDSKIDWDFLYIIFVN